MYSTVIRFEEEDARKSRARFFFDSYLDSGNDYNLYEAIKQASGSQELARSMTWGSSKVLEKPASKERA